VLGLALVAFALARPEGRSGDVLLGGLGIGAVVAGVWWVSGRLGHLAEHPQTLEEVFLATNSRSMESLSFVAPVAYALDWLILFSDKSKVLTIGIVSTAGVIVGSALVALATRSFRWEGFRGVEDTANHLVGALLMGVGGVTAMGCTIGQGLSGVSTLALGSFIALAGIMAGALLACAGRPGGGAQPVTASAVDTDADLERRFGGLRRLYGDAGYARARARIAVVGLGGVGAGRWKRWRAAAWPNWCCSTWTTWPNPTSTARCRRWAARWARPRRRPWPARGRHPPRLRGDMCVDDFVQPDNWPALLPAPVDVLIDACDQGSGQAGAGRLGAAPARRWCAWARPAASASPRPWRWPTWQTPPMTRCWPACASACARPGAAPRQGRMGVRCVFRASPSCARRTAATSPARRGAGLCRLRVHRHRDRHLRPGGRRRGHRTGLCGGNLAKR
jgi:hypothetical protein